MGVAALLSGRRPWLAGALGALALCAAGCSSSTTSRSGSAVTVVGSVLHVYVGQPPGPANQVTSDVLDAERLALKQTGTKVGSFTVQLDVAHGDEVSASARTAVSDKKAIAYLGELAPGTSGVSLPITNQVGLLQISPTDTAAYLTAATPAVADSPGHFYPSRSSFGETFARLVGTSAAETKALAGAMKSLQVGSLYVSDDGTDYGASVAAEIRSAARAQGITLASSAGGADGIFYAGLDGQPATVALDRLASANRTAKLFAPSALYDPARVAGLGADARRRLYVSAPGLPLTGESANARAFSAAFRLAYGHLPQPQAVYGYEAMSALMAVLKDLGANANSRAQVVDAFRGLRNRTSVLGTYSLTHGDPSVASFVIASPAGGRLVPRAIP